MPIPALISGLCRCLHIYSIGKETDVELRIRVKSLHDLIWLGILAFILASFVLSSDLLIRPESKMAR